MISRAETSLSATEDALWERVRRKTRREKDHGRRE
jgi:hypothetical protein